MTTKKSIFAAALVFGIAGLVGGCGGQFAPPEPISVSAKDGATQLLMEPVDIWDAHGAGEPSIAEVDGRALSVRKRGASLFDQSWVRLMLGWSSRRPNDVFIGAIALGPEVEVRGLRMNIDGQNVKLDPTSDFHVIPGKSRFQDILSNQDMHVGAFVSGMDWLRDVVESRDSVVVTLETSRGALIGDLNVVAGDSANALRGSAKNRFAEFLAAAEQAARN